MKDRELFTNLKYVFRNPILFFGVGVLIAVFVGLTLISVEPHTEKSDGKSSTETDSASHPSISALSSPAPNHGVENDDSEPEADALLPPQPHLANLEQNERDPHERALLDLFPQAQLVKETTFDVGAEYRQFDTSDRLRGYSRIFETGFKYQQVLVREIVAEPVGREARLIKRELMVADHLLVAPSKEQSKEAIESVLHGLGAKIRSDRGEFLLVEFTANEPEDLWRMQALLSEDEAFERAEPDYIVTTSALPNDPRFAEQWALFNDGSSGGAIGADIRVSRAWDITTGEESIVVAVIDSGVDYTHPDLAPNIWTNPYEIPENGVDDDANGFVDDVHGWDFFHGDADPQDDRFHGTHVAGIIGAVGNNDLGTSGVAWDVRIMAIKFLGPNGTGVTSDAVAAINYATQNNARLTNNSWGGENKSELLRDAILAAEDAGVLFVAAAGNTARNTDNEPNYPASFDLDIVLSVASSDSRDRLSHFSNYGLSSVDLAAPGTSILSTMPVAPTAAMHRRNMPAEYGKLSGTSMAAPHVAGVCALLWARNSNLTAEEVKSAILLGAESLPELRNRVLSGGRLSAIGSQESLKNPLLDPLKANDFLRVGDVRWEPATHAYTLKNTTGSTLEWSVTLDQTWLEFEPEQGELQPGESQLIVVAPNEQASLLETGTHEALLSLTTSASQTPIERQITASIRGFLDLPFKENFEAGRLDSVWNWSNSLLDSTSPVIAEYNPPEGAFHLVLVSDGSGYALNELTLPLDLQDVDNVELSFQTRSFNDEPNGPPPAPFLSGTNTDSVAVSVDGVHWYEVHSLRNLPAQYTQQRVDLSAAFEFFELNPVEQVYLRFIQYDNYPLPGDGVGIDEISITGLPRNRLRIESPDSISEGAGSVLGKAILPAPAAVETSVSLAVSPPHVAQVQPTEVIIPPNEQEATFKLRVADDVQMNGDRTFTLDASSLNLEPTSNEIKIIDNETGSFSFVLPASVSEGSTELSEGTVIISGIASGDIRLDLVAEPSEQLGVPPHVVVPAGSDRVQFSIQPTDDDKIDGDVEVTLSVLRVGWPRASSTISVIDDEEKRLLLELPTSTHEFAGVLSGSGRVKIAGTLEEDLTISLSSEDLSEIRVPSFVTIPAGSKYIDFDITAVDDGDRLTVPVTIRAESAGFSAASFEITVEPASHWIQKYTGRVLDMVYDSERNRILASDALEHRIIAIDPNTYALDWDLELESELGVVEISEDSEALYVALLRENALQEVNLDSRSQTKQIPLLNGIHGRKYPEEIESVPGQPKSIVVAQRWLNARIRHAGALVMDDGVTREKTTSDVELGPHRLEYDTASSQWVGLAAEEAQSFFYALSVDEQGIDLAERSPSLGYVGDLDFRVADGAVYLGDGRIFRIADWSSLGQLPKSDFVIPDSGINRLIQVNELEHVIRVTVYTLDTRDLLGSFDIESHRSDLQKVIRWGRDGLALATKYGIYIARTVFIPGSEGVELRVSPAAGLQVQGEIGGPFVNSSQSYLLTNQGDEAFTWQVTGIPAWLSASTTSGTLLPGASTEVALQLSPVANSMQAGHYDASILFENLVDGKGNLEVPTSLTIYATNTPPLVEAPEDLIVFHGRVVPSQSVLVSDPETAASSLVLAAESSNPAIVKNSDILLSGTGINRTLSLTAVPGAIGTSTVTITVSDGLKSSSDSFLVTVTDINTRPSITEIGNQRISEDESLSNLAFEIQDAETNAAALDVSINSSNQALIPDDQIFVSGVGRNRSLTILPVEDAFGTSEITLTVSDGELEASTQFTFSVNSVNDAPTLDPIAEQGTSGQAIEIHLTGITSGALNENQQLEVGATSLDTSLIPHPTVNYTNPATLGTLTLTPVPGKTGQTAITVTVREIGGGLIGEGNEATQVFIVSVGIPFIGSISSTHLEPGMPLTITGGGFSNDPQANIVRFGKVTADVLNATATELRVIVPTSASQDAISVTTGGLTVKSRDKFFPKYPSATSIDRQIFGEGVEFAFQPEDKDSESTTYVGAAASGDLDGDGKIDLVFSYANTSNIWVCRNTYSEGNYDSDAFAEPLEFPDNDTWVEDIFIEDMDNDGKLDIIVEDRIFLNTSQSGGLSFSDGIVISSEGNTRAIDDLNGDGKLDIVLKLDRFSHPWILKNTSKPGSLSFEDVGKPGDRGYFYKVFLDDIDGDGFKDILFTDATNDTTNIVDIYRNNNGNEDLMASDFDLEVTLHSRYYYPAKLRDFNRDGKNDIFYGREDFPSEGDVYINNSLPGQMQLTKQEVFDTQFITSLGPTDINGDGKTDSYSDGTFYLSNLDAAIFPEQDTFVFPEHMMDAILLDDTDFNGDSRPDIVSSIDSSGELKFILFESYLVPDEQRLVLENVEPQTVSVGSVIRLVGQGFSEEREQNLVSIGGALATVIEATPTKLFVHIPPESTSGPLELRVNGLQVVSPFDIFINSAATPIGANSFVKHSFHYETEEHANLVAEDFDGDGRVDFAMGTVAPSIELYRGVDQPEISIAFAASISLQAIGPYNHSPFLDAVDFDGDGKPDLVFEISDITSGFEYTSSIIGVLRNISTPGNIEFAPMVSTTVDHEPYRVLVADIDGDSREDLVTQTRNRGFFVVFNDSTPGAVEITNPVHYLQISSDYSNVRFTCTDLNHDGKAELIFASTDRLNVYENTTVERTPGVRLAFSQPFVSNGLFFTLFLTEDFDGDGKVDILYDSSEALRVLRNTHSSGAMSADSFEPEKSFPIDFHPYPAWGIPVSSHSHTTADLDGDGRKDYIFIHHRRDAISEVFVMQNLSNPGEIDFATPQSIVELDTGSLVATDLNSDGLFDLAFNTRYRSSPTLPQIHLFENVMTPASVVLESIRNQVTNEDTPITIDLFLAGLISSWETAALTATSSNPSLIPNEGLVFSGNEGLRQLQIRPATDRSGTCTIHVSVSVDDVTIEQSFDVTVNAVNDAPTMTAPDSVTLKTGGELMDIPIEAISAGGGENQAISLEAHVSKDSESEGASAIERVLIDYAGGSTATLRLTSGPTSGIVDVILRASDNGGLGYGGENTSTRKIRINVVDGYTQWSLLNLVPYGLPTDPKSDGDFDGISNFFEYALAADPRIADASIMAPKIFGRELNGEHFAYLAFRQRLDDPSLVYRVEISYDLKNWISGEEYVVSVLSVKNFEGTESIDTVTHRSLDPIKFLEPLYIRLSVSKSN